MADDIEARLTAVPAPPTSPDGGDTSADYLERRTLRRGSAGWLLLTGLGVAYVVSGDFSGWNVGLDKGGFGGLAIATVLMGAMYACLVFSLAELSTILPTAGGGYGFARRALGPWGGFLTGTAILIEYILAPAAIVIFIGDYVESLGLFGLTSSWPVYLGCFVVFIGVHLWGVGEALRFSLVVTAVAVAALLIFAVGAFTEFSADGLNDIPVDANAFGSNSWLPLGVLGIWAAFPFGMWFFLGVEGVPLAAEEAKDPVRSMPKALSISMGILALLALITFFAATGAQGADAVKSAGNPLVVALEGDGGPTALSRFVNYAGLAGLVASFFSLIYAGSRQLFALSRAGLPAPVPLPDLEAQGPVPGPGHPRRDRLRARRRHGRRRADAEHRGVRRDHLLRPDGPLAHGAAPPGAGPGAPVPHPRRNPDLLGGLRTRPVGPRRHLPGGQGRGIHRPGRVRRRPRLLRDLQSAPPRGLGPGGGVRGLGGSRGRAGPRLKS